MCSQTWANHQRHDKGADGTAGEPDVGKRAEDLDRGGNRGIAGPGEQSQCWCVLFCLARPKWWSRSCCRWRGVSRERGHRVLALCLSDANAITGARNGSLKPREVAVVHESGWVVLLNNGLNAMTTVRR